jgi:hypothetical protein
MRLSAVMIALAASATLAACGGTGLPSSPVAQVSSLSHGHKKHPSPSPSPTASPTAAPTATPTPTPSPVDSPTPIPVPTYAPGEPTPPPPGNYSLTGCAGNVPVGTVVSCTASGPVNPDFAFWPTNLNAQCLGQVTGTYTFTITCNNVTYVTFNVAIQSFTMADYAQGSLNFY